MCNQCQDLRAIHSGQKVFGVFHNGRFTMAFSKELQAQRTRILMQESEKCVQCNGTDCKWTVAEVDRKSVSWER